MLFRSEVVAAAVLAVPVSVVLLAYLLDVAGFRFLPLVLLPVALVVGGGAAAVLGPSAEWRTSDTAAFGGVVDGLIKGIIDPLIALLAPGDVKQLENALVLGPFRVGLVVSALVNFVMKAGVVYFFIVRPFSDMAAKLAAASAPPPDVQILAEIRDLLKERR